MKNGIWFFLAFLVICFVTCRERDVMTEKEGQVSFTTNSPKTPFHLALTVDGDDWGLIHSCPDSSSQEITKQLTRSLTGGQHSYFVTVSKVNGDIAGRVCGSFLVPSGGAERIKINLKPFFN